jgi:hypothetical protein
MGLELTEAFRCALEKPLMFRANGGVMVIPLRDCPFYRLLLHSLSSYYDLVSYSEDLDGGRAVCVSKPKELQDAVCPEPGVPLLTFLSLRSRRQFPRVIRHHSSEEGLSADFLDLVVI